MIPEESSQQLSDEKLNGFYQILQAVFKRKDATAAKKNELSLAAILKHPLEFVDTVVAFISSPNPSFEEDLKFASAKVIKPYFQKHLFLDDTAMERITAHINTLYKAMISNSTPMKYKTLLGNVFEELLLLPQDDVVADLLTSKITASFGSGRDDEVLGAMLTMYSALRNQTFLRRFKGDQELLAMVGTLAIQWSLLAKKELDGVQGKTSFSDEIAPFIKTVDTYTRWVYIIDEICAEINKPTFTILFEKGEVLSALGIVLALNMGSEDCPTISATGLKFLDIVLNALKFHTLQILTNLMAFLSKNNLQHYLLEVSKFTAPFENMLKICLGSLFTVCKSTIDTQVVMIALSGIDPRVNNVIGGIFSFLAALVPYNRYYSLFADQKKEIVIDVIFAFLRTPKAERDMLLNDLKQLRIAETVKAKCMNFMEALCAHIDGALSLVFLFATELLQYSFLSDDPSALPKGSQLLGPHINSIMMTRTASHIRVETALTVLTLIKELIINRPDLLYQFNSVHYINTNSFISAMLQQMNSDLLEYLLKTDDFLINMRFLQFALGYSDTLFKEDESEKFGLVIFEVVKHVGSFGINGKTALSLQAIHYFEEVANDSNKADIFRPFAEKVFEQLIEFAKNIPHYEFYKMIVNFLKVYWEDNGSYQPLTMSLVKALVVRIDSALTEFKLTGDEAIDELIEDCVLVIDEIAVEKRYPEEEQEVFAEIITTLLKTLKHSRIECKGVLLDDLSFIMKHTSGVSAPILKAAELLPEIFEKANGVIGPLFRFMNHFLVFSGKKDMSDIVDMFIYLACEAMSKAKKEEDRAQGALILHVILQYHGAILKQEQMQTIMKSTLNAINANPKQPAYRSKLFGVFLNGFMVNYQVIEDFLVSENQSIKLLRSMFAQIRDFETHYDQQVFVMGFCSVITQKKLHPEISQFYLKIFKSVVTILKIIEAAQSPIVRKENEVESDDVQMIEEEQDQKDEEEKKMEWLQEFWEISDDEEIFDEKEDGKEDAKNPKFSDEEEEEEKEDDGDSEEEGSSEEEEDPLEQAVNNLVSELKHKDEFNTFREAFYQFKANNADALAQLTAQLSSRRLDYLRDILLAHRVVTEGKVIIRKMLIPQNIKAPSHFSD